MLRKMFDAFDHCPRQQHATTCNNMQQMIHKCCVLLGKKFGSFDRGFKGGFPVMAETTRNHIFSKEISQVIIAAMVLAPNFY